MSGLPDDSIHIKAKGTAGQSLGAFLARGITIELSGEAMTMSAKASVAAASSSIPQLNHRLWQKKTLLSATLYCMVPFKVNAFFNGVAGERFAVRNSGATAVVEAVGDHGCEYMTGGIVVVLGSTGRNFAAGMSGGIAYVLDLEGDFESHCNLAQVELEAIAEEDDALESLDHQGGDLETHGRVDVSHDMTRFDAIRLHQLIEQHLHYTNSNRAREILENWSDYLPRFVKVMPVEYRRALLEMSAQQQGIAINS